MLLSISAWVMFIEVAVAARTTDRGPRLSDADLLQAMNLEFPGMDAVATAVAKGDQKAALEALAHFFRHRKEPCDFCPKPERDANASFRPPKKFCSTISRSVEFPTRFRE